MLKKRKPSTIDLIEKHLRRGRKLTGLQGLGLFRTLRLAHYIYILRKRGVPIPSRKIVVGPENKRVSEYWIDKKDR